MKVRRIALVAHDNLKKDMIEWVRWNSEFLIQHELISTGTTGRLVEEALKEEHPDKEKINILKLLSGPIGGDFQLGAMIVEGKIDLLLFLWDPSEPHPHDVDIRALLRIAVLHNIPFACNRASSDYLISSPLFDNEYIPKEKDFTDYVNRDLSVVKDSFTNDISE